MKIAILTTDLMFSLRVVAAGKALGRDVRVVAGVEQTATKLAPEAELVFLDLVGCGAAPDVALAGVRQAAPRARVVAFGPHVDEQLLAAASAAGCDQVISRGEFQKSYVQLLRDAG